jgi:hypothetical protein
VIRVLGDLQFFNFISSHVLSNTCTARRRRWYFPELSLMA